jgi:phosphatidylserine synthase
MKLNQKTGNILFQISAIAILTAAIVYNFDTSVAKYVMIAGAAGFAAATFTTPYPGKSLRGKRLSNIRILAVLFICVSAYLMFTGIKGWVVTMLIAAVLTLYCSIILPAVYKKEQEEDKK